ncbi:MAG: hypothetical protein PHQ83_06365 [Eubacteriales bacterium]|nr:hypothetical protein [Eubacteriales bacterium]
MKTKKMLVVLTIVTTILVAFASVSFAASIYGSPAEIIAGLTGKTTDEVYDAREAGETFGEQAVAAGELEAFRTARLEWMKERLAQLVSDGRLTQEEADARLVQIEEAIATCDGTGENAGGGLGGLMGGRGGRGGMGGDGVCDGDGIPAQDGTGSQAGGRGGRGGMGGWAQGSAQGASQA